LPESSQGIRGIRANPQDSSSFTTAEENWVIAEAAAGRFRVDTFTGDGVTTAFTLSQTYASYVIGAEGGRVLDEGDDFSASGTTLTLTYAAPSGSRILIVYRSST
jgi:hypothetical protein